MLEIGTGQVLFSTTARVFTRRCATPIVSTIMLWIQALLSVPRVEDRAGIAEYDHFGPPCYWNGKTAPSVFLHKQLDVTPSGPSGGSLTMVAHEPNIDVEQAPFLLFQLF